MADQIDSSRAQASEVHEATADASASPAADGDEQTTREQSGRGRAPESDQKLNPDMGNARIVSDQADDGGPVVIRDDAGTDAPGR